MKSSKPATGLNTANKIMEQVIKSKELRQAALGIDDLKPRKVFGLPSLDICQGREPPVFMSTEFFQQNSARYKNQLSMKPIKNEEEKQQVGYKRKRSSRRKRT